MVLIMTMQAIAVNQAWDGHPGSQLLWGLGNNSQVEVWTKPLGENRTAVFIINTEDKDMPVLESVGRPTPKTSDVQGYAGLGVRPCDSSVGTQRWSLLAGVVPGDNTLTLVKSEASKSSGCWEITACSESRDANVGTSYGCKPMPVPGPDMCKDACVCNGVWAFNANGTITAVMDGRCLQSDAHDVNVGICTGAANQLFNVTAIATRKPLVPSTATAVQGAAGAVYMVRQGANCVQDNPPPTPAPCPSGGCGAKAFIPLTDLRLGLRSGPVQVRLVYVCPNRAVHETQMHGQWLWEAAVPPPYSFPAFWISLLRSWAAFTSRQIILIPHFPPQVRDVWGKRTLPSLSATGTLDVIVPHHGSVFLVLMPPQSQWPLPYTRAAWMEG